MLKRTLYITEAHYVSVKNRQLIFTSKDDRAERSVPVEDIGFLVVENQQTQISVPALDHLIENNVAVVFCNSLHMPNSMLLTLDSHHLQGEIFRDQLSVSEPLRKNLWKQTIEAKIGNQIRLLEKLNRDTGPMKSYMNNVKSGDSDNREGASARHYWKELFGTEFKRERYGEWPNAMLNYGYTILRAAVARALTGSGLLPVLGIHHHNRYNAFALADDIMEPYRPFVDEKVHIIYESSNPMEELNKEIKAELLQVLAEDIMLDDLKRPLMVGLSYTTASLARCFKGEVKKIKYPLLI